MVRGAVSGDLDKILTLYDKVRLDRSRLGAHVYEAEVQKRGFLLGIDTRETITQEMKDAFSVLVSDNEGTINGYLIADHREEQKFYDDEYKTWFDTSLKEIYYKDPRGMTIATIATGPDSFRTGVATDLLRALEERLRSQDFGYLYSIITVAPLTNCSTIIWHTKNGFRRLAMGRPRRLFALDNYVGVLLCKEL